jgi:hypothetical protein
MSIAPRHPSPLLTRPANAATTPMEVYPGFLGSGWSFPPTFLRQGATVAMAEGDVDIKESIGIILTTRLGERIMQPKFGSNLSLQVFASLTPTVANEIAHLVTNALLEWEPRITVIDVTVTLGDVTAGRIDVSIDYLVRQTNTRSNLVFPYYILEATLAAPT